MKITQIIKITILIGSLMWSFNSLASKEYSIECTPILDGERICFITGTADGRIRFNIPCECGPCDDIDMIDDMDDVFDYYEDEEEFDDDYKEFIPTSSIFNAYFIK